MSGLARHNRLVGAVTEDWIEDNAQRDGSSGVANITTGTLTVQSGLTLNEWIDRGRFDAVTDDNIEGFRRTGHDTLFSSVAAITDDQHGDWDYAVYQFADYVSTPAAERQMQNDGYERAGPGHFFAYAETAEKLPCGAVIATGTPHPDIILMVRERGRRELDLAERGGAGDGVPTTHGFLGVKKR